MRNFNTVEDFKKLDKKEYLADALAKIKSCIENEEDFQWQKGTVLSHNNFYFKILKIVIFKK